MNKEDNTKNESMASLIEELKNISLDNEFSLSKKELKNLKRQILKEDGHKVRGIFALPLFTSLLNNKLALAAIGGFFALIAVGGVLLQFIPNNILKQEDNSQSKVHIQILKHLHIQSQND